jgi:hypothetical protein
VSAFDAMCRNCGFTTAHVVEGHSSRQCLRCHLWVRVDAPVRVLMKTLRLNPPPVTREALLAAVKAFHAVYGVEATEMHLTRPQIEELKRWIPHEAGGAYQTSDPFDPQPGVLGPHCTFMGIDTYLDARVFTLAEGADGPENPDPHVPAIPLTRRSHEPDFGVRERAIDL